MPSKRLLSLSFLILGISLPGFSNRLLVVTTPDAAGKFGYGYENSNWDEMTGLLVDAFGAANITTATSAANATAYDAVWVDQRWTKGLLTADERTELTAFAATDRRMVLIGENSSGSKSWSAWNSQILGLLGGVPGGSSNERAEQTLPTLQHELTLGVDSLTMMNDGFASGGISLFDRDVANLWGGDQSVLTWMSINMQDDNHIDLGDNRQFAYNVANWLATGPVHAPEPSTYAMFGVGLAGLAYLSRRARKR